MAQRLELTWYNKDQALIPTDVGRYDYTWVSPNDPRYCETHTLVVDDYVAGTQQAKDPTQEYGPLADAEPQTDNLLITGESGDVLEALTRVPELAEKYLGSVRCVYIDPPFNTQKTFAHYEDNLEHSVWLTMMRDRLVHLRRLLHASGSIWVHLDDSEVHRMRSLLDEEFGSGNFISMISWEKVAGRDNRSIMSKTCDFILVYAKSKEAFKSTRNLLPRDEAATGQAYSNPDADPRGPWTSGDFTAQFNPEENPRENQLYTLETPNGRTFNPPKGLCWRYTEPRYREMVADNRVWFGEDGNNVPRLKRFLSEVQDGLVPKTLWTAKETGTNDTGKKEVATLFPGVEPFATPKPEKLLERIIHIATNPGDIVLDVFAGSGTTAAVAQKMGRRWVTCELSDDTVRRYTQPRLEAVVRADDDGGVTMTPGRRIVAPGASLPNDMSPGEAQQLTSLLNKAIKGDATLKKDRTVKALKSLVRTSKSPARVNWRGGGGFHTAHLSPAVFGLDERHQRVLLTQAAADYPTLVAAVAAQLGFRLTPGDQVFQGRKGRTLLAVRTLPMTPETVQDVVSQLPEGAGLVLAATNTQDGARESLRKSARGARLVQVPQDLFRMEAEK